MPQTIDHPKLGALQFPDGMSDGEIVAVIKKLEAAPTRGPNFDSALAASSENFSMMGPATKGDIADVAKFSGRVVGMGADMAMEGGGATAGQAAGALGGPFAPITVPVGGAIGGGAGNIAAQQRRIAAGEQDKFSYGQLAGAAISGAIPGASLGKAGLRSAQMAKEVGKNVAGNVVAAGAEAAIDTGGLPSAPRLGLATLAGAAGPVIAKGVDLGAASRVRALKQLENSLRDKTLVAAIDKGFVIAPTHGDKLNPGLLNSALESIGGKAATSQEASLRNQRVTNALVRQELGVPEGVPLTPEVMDGIRKDAAQPYAVISQMSEQAKRDLDILEKSRFTAANRHELEIQMSDPDTVKEVAELATKAGADINALKMARFEASSHWDHYYRSADPESLKIARAATTKAEGLENKIEEAVTRFGHPELLDQLKTSRKRIAQSYEVEHTLNAGDGNVDASVLGRALESKKKLTGNLEVIAKFERAFGSDMREAGKVPTPNVNQLKTVLAATGAGAALMQGHPQMAVLAGAAPFVVPMAAKKAILSRPYQQFMAKPGYGPDTPDAAAQFARFMTMAAGRDEPNPFLQAMAEAYPRKPDSR